MHLLIIILLLAESMSYHTKSLYIVFKMPESITIYTNAIANTIILNISKNVQHVQMCEFQNGDLRGAHAISDMDLGNPCDVS